MKDGIADRSGPVADGPDAGRRPRDVSGELPPVRVEPDVRRRIRRALVEAGRRIAAGLLGGFNLLLPDQHPQPVRSDEPIA